MKQAALAVGVLVILTGAVAALVILREDPTGMAVGTGPADQARGRALWEALAPYGDSYLNAYSDVFMDPPDDPLLLLAAFNELGYAVTGPAGLWRKRIPSRYFGCEQQDLPICMKFKEMEPMLREWDRFQARVGEVDSERQARRFIRANYRKLREYLEQYVPQDRSLSAVQQTPFFTRHLSAALEHAPSM